AHSRFVSISPAPEPSAQDDPSVNKIHGSGSSSSTSMGTLNELEIGDPVHESRYSHALRGSLNISTLNFESLHEVLCGFPFSLLDVVDFYRILDALLLMKHFRPARGRFSTVMFLRNKLCSSWVRTLIIAFNISVTTMGPSPRLLSYRTHARRVEHGRKGKEISQGNLNGTASDAALREYCDRHYNQLLPILAEKIHQEKLQQENLKEVKARLNIEEVSQHFESGTLSKTRDLRKRLGLK
nr:reverse transcriptase domain-containing protein [Tanacetum cinerariifolium]